MASDDQWDRWAETYAHVGDDVRRRFLYPEICSLLNADSTEKMTLLDYGSGPGDLAALLVGRFNSLVLVDRAASARALASGRLQGQAEVWDIADLDRSGRQFDRIVCSLVMTTIPDDDQWRDVLTRLHRHLLSGGQLLLATTHPCFTFRAMSQTVYMRSGGAYHVPLSEEMVITEYHRPLGAVLSALAEHRFRLRLAREITDSVEYHADHNEPIPRFAGELPMFLILVYEKDEGGPRE